jgi:prepilin-type N-terminal cleavage/methylation domain-containing protein
MRIWTAATSRNEWGKRGNSETVKKNPCTSYFSDSPILRFSDSAIFSTPNAGFTLLELSLVLFILGLLVTVLLPRFGDMGSARLESSARRLAALARYLNGEAAFSGQVYRIRYDLGEQTYAVQVLVPSREATEFVADPSPMSQPVKLPPGIAFADVRVSQAGRMNTGQVFTHFYPHGYVDPTVVHLRDQRERMMTVMIPPITGEAKVYEGYVDGTGR